MDCERMKKKKKYFLYVVLNLQEKHDKTTTYEKPNVRKRKYTSESDQEFI